MSGPPKRTPRGGFPAARPAPPEPRRPSAPPPAPRRESAAPAPPAPPRPAEAYVAAPPFDPSHPKALAVYCSDGRFTEAVEDLARRAGHGRIDTLTMPGGPGLLNLLSAGFVELDAMTRAATFLIRGHAIDHVLLVAHEGCGYYRSRYPMTDPRIVARQQRQDLEMAARAIELPNHGVQVHLFYARPIEGRIAFEPIARTKA